MTTSVILTSGEVVQAEHVREDIYRLPGGRLVRTWTEDGHVYQDPDGVQEFRCPKCGGRHWGTVDLDAGTVECHARGCGWRGMRSECGL